MPLQHASKKSQFEDQTFCQHYTIIGYLPIQQIYQIFLYIEWCYSKRRITTSTINDKIVSRWSTFQPRANQTLAPITRRDLENSEIEDLESNLSSQTDPTTILIELKSRPRRTRPGYKKRTKRDEDCLLINIELDMALKNVKQSRNNIYIVILLRIQGVKMKYIHFHENIRPPYYGTDRRVRSTAVYARRPCGKDPKLDYTEDSGK